MNESSSPNEPPISAVIERMDRIIVLLEKLVQAHHAEIAEYQGRLSPIRRWHLSEPPPPDAARDSTETG